MKPTRTCAIDGCERSLYARDLCEAHYARSRRGGKPGSADLRRNTRGMTIEEKFRHYTDASGGDDACHMWTGPVSGPAGNQYGVIYCDGVRVKPHRWILGVVRGEPLGPGDEAMYSCDTPLCVNPRHLSVGTHAENMADMRTKGRSRVPLAAANATKGDCIRGHELVGDNLYIDSQGKRQCRACRRIREAAYRARRKAKAST